MSYQVQQGDIFGRIGSGLGQGLADSLPKEIERGRMIKGLQDFEKDSANLTPIQTLARLSSIPGITPQMIQSFGDLAKQQNIRNAYGKGRKGTQEELTAAGPSNTAQAIANTPFGGGNLKGSPKEKVNLVEPSQSEQPQIVDTNPMRDVAQPRGPWSKERFDNEVRDVLERGLTNDPAEARNIASQNEARELAVPQTEQARDQYKNAQAEKIKTAFQKRVELLTQKTGENVFADVTGEMMNNFIRTVDRDLANNPNKTMEDIVNERANQLLQIPKTKKQIDVLANRDIWDKISPLKKSETLKKLLSATPIFDAVNDNEEYYNILKTKEFPEVKDDKGNVISPSKKGLGLSPAAAAWIAYPRSPEINNFIKTIHKKPGQDRIRTGKYYGSQVGDKIQKDDSILSIYRELKNKDPYFDDNAFFDQLRERQYDLTDRQKREFIEGEQDYFPDWGDIAIFPLTSGGLL